MSGLIVGLVLRLPITKEFNTEAKFIATVYADHAWEDGTHAHPAIQTVAGIVGLHERTVQRYVRFLEKCLLVRDGMGPKGTNQYKFLLHSNADGSVGLIMQGGGTRPPRQAATGGADSGDRDSGGAAVSPKQLTPQNLVVVVNAGDIFQIYEREIGALTPLISDAIKDACDTYPIDWIPEAIEIAVKQNKRTWNYVEGILRNCKSAGMRPSQNKLEVKYGQYQSSRRSGAKKDTRETRPYSDADRAAAERVRQRKGRQPNMS